MTRTTDNNDITDFFFKQSRLNTLLLIQQQNPCTATDITEKLDANYSYVVKTVGHLYHYGVIQKHNKGRKTELRLTDKGETLAEHLYTIADSVDELDVPSPEKTRLEQNQLS